MERLRARTTDAEYLRAAAEEILRFDGPSKMQVRMAATDIDVGDEVIRRHDMVYLVPGGRQPRP